MVCLLYFKIKKNLRPKMLLEKSPLRRCHTRAQKNIYISIYIYAFLLEDSSKMSQLSVLNKYLKIHLVCNMHYYLLSKCIFCEGVFKRCL